MSERVRCVADRSRALRILECIVVVHKAAIFRLFAAHGSLHIGTVLQDLEVDIVSVRGFLYLHHVWHIWHRVVHGDGRERRRCPEVLARVAFLAVDRQTAVGLHLIKRDFAVGIGVDTLADLYGEGQYKRSQFRLVISVKCYLSRVGRIVLCRHRDFIGRVERLLVGNHNVPAGTEATAQRLLHIVVLVECRTLREEDEAVRIELILHLSHALLALHEHRVEVGVVEIKYLIGRRSIFCQCSCQGLLHHVDREISLRAGNLGTSFRVISLEGTTIHRFL